MALDLSPVEPPDVNPAADEAAQGDDQTPRKGSLQSRVNELRKRQGEAERSRDEAYSRVSQFQASNDALAKQVEDMRAEMAAMRNGATKSDNPFPGWNDISAPDLVQQGMGALQGENPDTGSFMKSILELATRQSTEAVNKVLDQRFGKFDADRQAEAKTRKDLEGLNTRIRRVYGEDAFTAESALVKSVQQVAPLVAERYGQAWQEDPAAIEYSFALGRTLQLETDNKRQADENTKLREQLKGLAPRGGPVRALERNAEAQTALEKNDIPGAISNLGFMRGIKGDAGM